MQSTIETHELLFTWSSQIADNDDNKDSGNDQVKQYGSHTLAKTKVDQGIQPCFTAYIFDIVQFQKISKPPPQRES